MTAEINNKINVKNLLEQQQEEFAKQIAEQNANMQKQIEEMVAKNTKLQEELDNLKTNTAEENALLGEQIKKVTGKKALPDYNPFRADILYSVKNEKAGITTILAGDEVKGIIGAIDKHLKEKLIKGEKTIVKHPYTITKIEKKVK